MFLLWNTSKPSNNVSLMKTLWNFAKLLATIPEPVLKLSPLKSWNHLSFQARLQPSMRMREKDHQVCSLKSQNFFSRNRPNRTWTFLVYTGASKVSTLTARMLKWREKIVMKTIFCNTRSIKSSMRTVFYLKEEISSLSNKRNLLWRPSSKDRSFWQEGPLLLMAE